jgi:cytosine deaminase
MSTSWKNASFVATAFSAASLGFVTAWVVLGRGSSLLPFSSSSSDPTKASLRSQIETAGGTYLLKNVRLPTCLLPQKPNETTLIADTDDGFSKCHIRIAGGKVVGIESAVEDTDTMDTERTNTSIIECHGCIVLPCFVDSHTHLVKAHTHARARNPTGTMNDALFVELNDQARWIACHCCRPKAMRGGSDVVGDSNHPMEGQLCPKAGEDLFRRMDFALRTAYHHGTKYIRTHLDGTGQFVDPPLRKAVFSAYHRCRTAYGKQGLQLEGVANLYLPLWDCADIAEKHVHELLAQGGPDKGLVLGAYCGNQSEAPRHETLASLDALFGYARQHGFHVDLHIDETNDPDCCLLEVLIESLRKARSKGYEKDVLLGHCTSLTLQTESKQREILRGLVDLNEHYSGSVVVVCNPTTNLGLQDRRGSQPPVCKYIDPNTPRTPMWRGLTAIQELEAAGVPILAASDNIRDFWHPYGDLDPLQTLKGAITLGHLDTCPQEGYWTKLVTARPCDGSSLLETGSPADLVLFPQARSASELLSRSHQQHYQGGSNHNSSDQRIVLRKGRAQVSILPSYRELDDLVEVPTRIIQEKTREGVIGSVVGMEG